MVAQPLLSRWHHVYWLNRQREDGVTIAAANREFCMRLTPEEQTWVDTYRQALTQQYPDVIASMVIYGSKARGDAHPDSDLDVLLVVKNEADALRRPLRRLGYTLAVALEALPSILVYTRAEWDRRKQSGSPFRQAVERDAVPVL
jgi:predicted nucleotidyltransferase